jgi:hypothetical protein
LSTTEIIAVLHSAHFKKGLLEGYGILVTPEKIVGAKKFKMGFFAALLLDESKLDIATRMKAYEVAKEIEENKDFEVPLNQLLGLELKKPGRLWAGHLHITSTGGEYKVKIVAQTTATEFRILQTALTQLAPNVLKMVQ